MVAALQFSPAGAYSGLLLIPSARIRPSANAPGFVRAGIFPTVSKVPKAYIGERFFSRSSWRCMRDGSHGQQSYHSDYASEDYEPFWLTMLKDVVWGIRSLFSFLAEQPSQLRYIEWPSFPNMLKTSTLTLVLVAFLIVALSSIDSALSYILAWLLRKAA